MNAAVICSKGSTGAVSQKGGFGECALVPVFGNGEHLNVPSFRVFGAGEHLPKPPFWNHPFANPRYVRGAKKFVKLQLWSFSELSSHKVLSHGRFFNL